MRPLAGRLAIVAVVGMSVLTSHVPHAAAAEPVHAPTATGHTYLRAKGGVQAARDWAWRLLGTRQFLCLDQIGWHESGWRVNAGSLDGSWGIFQAAPPAKMARYGRDWRTQAMPQVRFGIAYANARYGDPCRAWAFWQLHGWW